MKKLLLIFSLFYFSYYNAQTVFFVENETVYISNGGVVWIDGDYQTAGTGIVDHYGDLHLSGDWINNSTNTGLTSGSDGDVIMFATAQQEIMGSSETHFHDLLLTGASVKNMQVNAHVLDTLNLFDAQLQTDDFIMYADNAEPTSVLWNNGFVNSDKLGGYFVRAMNSTSTYDFPVGDANLTSVYRGVTVTPTTIDTTAYGVRLKAIDPTIDLSGTSFSGSTGGYDVTIKNDELADINTRFYHNISRFHGAEPANIDIHYFSPDGDFFQMAQWQESENQWEPTLFQNNVNNGPVSFNNPDYISSIVAKGDFNEDAFALSGVDLTIPEFISPDGDALNQFFVIENLDKFPGNNLKIFNRYGSLVYETDDYNSDWDGSASSASLVLGDKNAGVPSGTYYYILDLNNDIPVKQGFFVLQR